MAKTILMVLEGELKNDERVRKEAISLSNLGFSVIVLCYARDIQTNYEEWGGIKIYRKRLSYIAYKTRPLILDLPLYEFLWKNFILEKLGNHNVDFLHVHDLPLLRLMRKISVDSNIPLIVDLHENRPEIMRLYGYVNSFPGKFLISIDGWLKYQEDNLRLVDKVILVTEEASAYYRKHKIVNQNCNLSVWPNFPSLKKMKSVQIDNLIEEEYREKFCIVYMGDTSLRRGTLDLLLAARELIDVKDVHFLIIGDSKDQKTLSGFVKKEKLENVTLTGFLPFERAMSYISASRLGVCPLKRNIHHDTTYAAKLFNYMYYGKPLIVSDCEAQKNLVENSNNGRVYKSGDINGLVKEIMFLRSDDNIYLEYSRNSSTLVKTKYNWEIIEERMNSVYE